MYEAYYYYVSMILDSMITAKLDALSESLTSALAEARSSQLVSMADYEAIGNWLDTVDGLEADK